MTPPASAHCRGLFVRRWIVKDLAQFWYSTTKLNVTEEQHRAWLAEYAPARRTAHCPGLAERDYSQERLDFPSRPPACG